ncbi:MAG TPA: MFS transporter [Candidatus Limnocylindrales bacterium]|nr:MFS transporter [Candidatus Limnocylindrales bacterium]
MRLPASLEVLRERNFARYLAAIVVSQLGNGMANVALAFAVLGFGTPTDLGIVLLSREIPMIAFLLLGGVFADRLPRRTILVSTDLVRATAQVATALLLFTGNAHVWNVAVVQVAYGIANAFQRPVGIGLVKETVSDAHLQQANALQSLSRSTLSVVSPAVGALLVAIGSPAIAIAVDATTFFVSAALLASMRLPGTVRAATKSVVGDLRDGWREFISRPWVVAIIASFGLFQLTYFPALLVLGPTVAKDSLGGAAGWGTILAIESLGAVAGGLFALRVRVTRPLIWSELAVVPAGFLLLALAVPMPLWAIAGVGFVVGIGFALGENLYVTAFQRNIPEHALSRISSYDWFGSVALNPLGYALIGPVAAAIGIPETLIIAGVLNVLTCFIVLAVPSVRAIRSDPPGDAAQEMPAT